MDFDIFVTKISRVIFFLFISTVFHKPTGLGTNDLAGWVHHSE
jgi:hypothetical protein